ncbi:MAG: hypothetical protein HXY35_12405 [Chloroflexi bacterium]|nr:hypothetical protein [Chloroflexota bacterium]
MTRKIIHGVLAILLAGILFATSRVPFVTAEKSSGWTPNQRVPGYFSDTFTPYLLADQNRTVHAFASQWVGDAPRQLAIVYRQWSLMGGWTKPVDIILPLIGESRIQEAFLDSSGMMHVIFWGGTSREAYIFYSKAPVESADESSAWSSPIVIGDKAVEPSSAALTGDGQGNLFMIYTGNLDGAGVYETHSNDSGETWSKARPIFMPYDIGLVPYSLKLVLGKSGQLHATWNVVTSRGTDMSLHYAQYDIAADQWSEVVTLSKRVDNSVDYFGPSFPSIVDNGKYVVIMYNNGNPFNSRPVPAGRPIQMVSVSEDGGRSWNDPVVPFYRHLGRSGEHSLVVDSDNVVHALFVQRIEYTVDGENRLLGGVWHSAFQDGIWSDPDRFVTSYPPHDVRAVVSQGNVLLVVWRQDPGAEELHGVWYSYTILDSPELPVIIPPSQTPESAPATAPASVPNPEETAVPVTKIPTISLEDVPSGIASNPAGPLIIAIIPVLLVLAGVIFMYRIYSNKNG